ncbi:hypothetical protein D3C85_981190 [compost metagenome]
MYHLVNIALSPYCAVSKFYRLYDLLGSSDCTNVVLVCTKVLCHNNFIVCPSDCDFKIILIAAGTRYSSYLYVSWINAGTKFNLVSSTIFVNSILAIADVKDIRIITFTGLEIIVSRTALQQIVSCSTT